MHSHLRLTLDGLRELIADARAAGHSVGAIVVNPIHKTDLLEELKDMAPDFDIGEGMTVGFIQGAMILARPEVPRGKAWLVPKSGPVNNNTLIPA